MASALELALLRGGLPGQTLAETVGGINVGLESRRREGLAASMVADLLGGQDDPQLQAMGQAIRQNPFAARQMLQAGNAASDLLTSFEARRASRAETSQTNLESISNALLIQVRSASPDRDSFMQNVSSLAQQGIPLDPGTVNTIANSYPDQFSDPRQLMGTDTIVQEGPGGKLSTVVSGAEALQPPGPPTLGEPRPQSIAAFESAIPRTASSLARISELDRLIEAAGPAGLGDAGYWATLADRGRNFATAMIGTGAPDRLVSTERARLEEGGVPAEQAQVIASGIMGLAAELLEAEGGVPSEKDIERVMRQIAGSSGNPRVIRENLRRMGNERVQGLEFQRESLGFGTDVRDQRYPQIIRDYADREGLFGDQPAGAAAPAPALPEGATIRTDPESGRRFWFTGTQDAPTDSGWID